MYDDCDNNTISNNTVNDNWMIGILLITDNDYNHISGNVITGNLKDGLILENSSSNNFIANNSITNNYETGINIRYNSSFNILTQNVIWFNNYGLTINDTCEGNLIYQNSISFNRLKSGIDNGTNIWNNDEIGNYWSDYIGLDLNFDGIGDTPYYISGTGNQKDSYPLVGNYAYFKEVPEDLVYEINSLTNILKWRISSKAPFLSPYIRTYEIFKDGSSVTKGTFTLYDSFEVEINAVNLPENNYSYSIDIGTIALGVTLTDYATVSVTNTEPEFNEPLPDISYEVGTEGNSISWMINDPSTINSSYKVYKDEIEILSDVVFIVSEYVEIAIDGLEMGSYVYAIEVDDGYGKIIRGIFNVKVNNTSPNITTQFSNITYEEGSSGNNISWTASDPSMNNPTYSVYRDGIKILSDIQFNPGDSVLIPINGLNAGNFIYLIELNDGFGESAIESVWINVIEQTGNPFSNFLEENSAVILSSIIGFSIVLAAIIHGRIVRVKPKKSKPDQIGRGSEVDKIESESKKNLDTPKKIKNGN